MIRAVLIAIALICSVAACSPAPESSPAGSSGAAIPAAGQDATRAEITPEKIVRDVVGHVVKVSAAAGDGPPTDWTFEADEFRQVEIVDRETTQATAAITVSMTTRNNPGSDEEAVQVSGRLKLHYQRKGSEWVLTAVENLTFSYTIGVST